MKQFLQRWVINTLSVLVAVYLVKGIHYEKPLDLVVASLLLGILNAILRPVLMVLALPLVLLSLGLFMFVINALVLYSVGYLLKPSFVVDDFRSAFWAAFIISITSLILNALTGVGNSRVNVQRGGPRPTSPPPSNRNDSGGGGGPVIDV